jgi:HlyD family secretion protein
MWYRHLLTVGLIFLFFSCAKKKEQFTVRYQPITESVYASAVVKSKHQYQVYSKVNGLLEQLFVAEGDLVNKGTPLFRVSNPSVQLNADNAQIAADYAAMSMNKEKLAEAKSAIGMAKLTLENDRLLMERQRDLWRQQIGSRIELEQRELAYQKSKTAFDAANYKYAELQKQLAFAAKQAKKNLEISAAIAGDYVAISQYKGKVYQTLIDAGEMVTTQTLVAVIGDAEKFELELEVDEYDIAKIRIGQKMVLQLDSYKDSVFDAQVSSIIPIMNERSKTFTIHADFIQQPSILYPNVTAEANIIIAQKDSALIIPRIYLIDGQFVLMQNKEKRKVTIGLKDYEQVEILQGLKPGEIILKPEQ